MDILVIGIGYGGLITPCCLANSVHQVTWVGAEP